MSKDNRIVATKNGQIKTFHPNIWRNMPNDKFGWVIHAPITSDIEQQLVKKQSKVIEPIKEEIKANDGLFEEQEIDLSQEGLESEEVKAKRGRKPKED